MNVYKYMHIYSPKRVLNCTMDITNNQFHNHVKPDLHYLCEKMNEIHWEDRLSPWNHAYHFPSAVTFMVDTFPVRVSEPEDSALGQVLFNPKYGSCVYKFQCAVTFLGVIPLFTGPHLGTSYDGNIYEATEDKHPTHPSELGVGDGAYVACKQMLCPHRRPPKGALTEDQLLTNTVISHYRARVEHKNKLLERHNILGKFRGGLELLMDAAHVQAQTENVDAKLHLRYPPVGPWKHF